MEPCDLNILFDIDTICDSYTVESSDIYEYLDCGSYGKYLPLLKKIVAQINTTYDYKNIKTLPLRFPIHDVNNEDGQFRTENNPYYNDVDWSYGINELKNKAIYRKVMELKRWLYDNNILYVTLSLAIYDDKHVAIEPFGIYKLGNVCYPKEALLTDCVKVFLAHNCVELLTFDEMIRIIDDNNLTNLYKYLFKNYTDEVKKRSHLLTYNSKCYHYYCYKKLCELD